MTDEAPEPEAAASAESTRVELSRRHLRLGWWGLFVFVTLGLALESLHGLKVGYYLDAANEARRLVWRLAHAHGTLLSLVNVVYGLTVRVGAVEPDRGRVTASAALVGATVLLPGGFFAGGLFVHGGDPGLGVLLVPVGAVLLLVAVLLVARAVR